VIRGYQTGGRVLVLKQGKHQMDVLQPDQARRNNKP